jgi:hypothetical protein
MKKTTGTDLAGFYKIPVKQAHYHNNGNWFWNLKRFPGAYFDDFGYIVFQTEDDYAQCVYLSIGPRNTGIRGKNSGMSIADIPGYQKLEPPPKSHTK